MVKKNIWWKHPGTLLSMIAGIGIAGTFIVKSAIYITLPDRVQAAEEKVKTVEDYIKEQQLANHLMEKLVQQKENKELILSPDGRRYYDTDAKEWKPIKK